jgi:hypothetical protein
MRAAQAGWAEGVERLLPVSSPATESAHGETALIRAARANSPECVRLLLPVSNAKIKSDMGWTALSAAASVGALECVKLLLPASDPSAAVTSGMAAGFPLKIAVGASSARSTDVAQLIFEALPESERGVQAFDAFANNLSSFSDARSEALAWAAAQADYERVDAAKPQRGVDWTLRTLCVGTLHQAPLRAALAAPWFETPAGQEALARTLGGLLRLDASLSRKAEISASADLVAMRLSLSHPLAPTLLASKAPSFPGFRALCEAAALRSELGAEKKNDKEDCGVNAGSSADKPPPRL